MATANRPSNGSASARRLEIRFEGLDARISDISQDPDLKITHSKKVDPNILRIVHTLRSGGTVTHQIIEKQMPDTETGYTQMGLKLRGAPDEQMLST